MRYFKSFAMGVLNAIHEFLQNRSSDQAREKLQNLKDLFKFYMESLRKWHVSPLFDDFW